MITSLKQEVIEEGREHPFVEALVKELGARLKKYRDQLEAQAPPERICWLQGGAAATRVALDMIQKAEGEHE